MPTVVLIGTEALYLMPVAWFYWLVARSLFRREELLVSLN